MVMIDLLPIQDSLAEVIHDTIVVNNIDTVFVLSQDSSIYDFTYWIPIIIALSAVGVSFYTGLINRKHNILSVKSLLQIESDFTPKNSSIDFTIVNHGIGPAIIVSYKFFVNGEEILGNLSDNFNARKIFGNDPEVQNIKDSVTEYSPGAAISPGAPKKILSFDFSDSSYINDSIGINLLLHEWKKLIIEKLRIEIIYELMYKEMQFKTIFPPNKQRKN